MHSKSLAVVGKPRSGKSVYNFDKSKSTVSLYPTAHNSSLQFPSAAKKKIATQDYQKKPQKRKQRKPCCSCMKQCWQTKKRFVLMGFSFFNLLTSLLSLVWLWYLEEPPPPPVLGYGWWSEMRMLLMPESCISVGHSLFLVHGTFSLKKQALFVAALAQTMQAIGAFLFFLYYVLNYYAVMDYVIYLCACYVVFRSFMLYLTAECFKEMMDAEDAAAAAPKETPSEV